MRDWRLLMRDRQATKPFTVKSDEDSILATFTTVNYTMLPTQSNLTISNRRLGTQFVRVHQELLNIMIGKSNLLDQIPFIGGPIASVLRSIESVVDVSPP